jgi:hypothetical protein
MSRPSNIKIQKTGAEGIGNGHGRLPASDLERYAAKSVTLATIATCIAQVRSLPP